MNVMFVRIGAATVALATLQLTWASCFDMACQGCDSHGQVEAGVNVSGGDSGSGDPDDDLGGDPPPPLDGGGTSCWEVEDFCYNKATGNDCVRRMFCSDGDTGWVACETIHLENCVVTGRCVRCCSSNKPDFEQVEGNCTNNPDLFLVCP